MNDLTDWLLEQITFDEAAARDYTHVQALAENGHYGMSNRDRERQGWAGVQRLGWTPERILAECEAKRRIVEQVSDVAWGGYAVRDVILATLAAVYSRRPGYREQWRT